MNKQKFYITTAIPYASQKPHFGNTYEVIMTDAVARYKRARGYDVFFCTGTDEHGQKIENCAAAAGVTPQEYANGVSESIRAIWDLMNTTYDKLIRTTDDYHVTAVQNIFKKLYDQGDIYKSEYEGWYCTPDESFYTDTQVVDGKCPDCGRPVQRAKEEAYFLRLTKYADKLIDYINKNPGLIEPESRRKEMMNNFLLPGLQDLCVSRTSFKWGVPVTFDDKHVIYVWIDALSNYITALGYDPAKEVQPELFQKYWPADVHMIGKDIVRFHSIYWTIILMALGLPLPEKVFGHPWFNFGVDKMSKSRGNVIYADRLAELFTVDGVRHYALAEMPYNSDGSITYESVIARFNNDLVNNLGNLVKRTLDMQKKYFGGVIQAPTAPAALDDELKTAVKTAYDAVVENMDGYHISDAVEAIFTMLRRANKYIDETTPWSLAKDEAQKERLGTVLYNLLEVIRTAAVLLTSFIPATAEEILRELNAENELAELKRSADEIGRANAGYLLYDEFIGEFGKLEAGKTVGDSKVLFARIDEKKMMEQLNAELEAARAAAEAKAKADAVPEKPEGCAVIGIDDFMKVELRTAKVLAAEPVPKAKKLLKLQLDLGYEQRQVVSGIAKFYKPEQLIGRRVAMVANLAPAKLCGIESQGMILASGEEQVRVVFLADDTPLGERIR
ncbi:MAG: methionine--tRNA ligase [Clostridia bacterium]|nr:methionine--tRNA ligase [Clostridia bacterium]